ncbi:MAG: helix-turn-helix domain-containing protein [Solirubrobacterales bacterium]
MASGIGATLRETRSRRKLDLSEVENAIKIRARYLQAMENEDWDALPGGTYTRAFIRTYAAFLGLDGERLANDYRSREPASEERPFAGSEPSIAPNRWPATRLRPGRVPGIAIALALIAALIALGLLLEGNSQTGGVAGGGEKHARQPPQAQERRPSPSSVALRLVATAEVWVCLLDANREALIDGQILEPGTEEGPFRSRRFTVSLGNGEVALSVDGKDVAIPATASPIGYQIGAGGELRPLSESARPTCT